MSTLFRFTFCLLLLTITTQSILGQTDEIPEEKNNLKSTFEISTSPLLAIIEPSVLTLSVQKPLNHSLEVGADLWYVPASDWSVIYAKAAYYFKPKLGADKFHAGIFAGKTTDAAGIGFFFGYKVLSKKRIFMNLATGIGRGYELSVSEQDPNFPVVGRRRFTELLPYGQVHIGYRFGSHHKN